MPKPFKDTLAIIEMGAFGERIADELAKLVRSVGETSGKGELIVKIGVKQLKNGAMDVSTDVTCKMPKPKDAPTTLLWPTVEGNLTQNNPNQRELNLAPNQPTLAAKPPQQAAS